MTLIPDEAFGDYCPSVELFVALINGDFSEAANDWMKANMPNTEMHKIVIREAFHMCFSNKGCVRIEASNGFRIDYAFAAKRILYTFSE